MRDRKQEPGCRGASHRRAFVRSVGSSGLRLLPAANDEPGPSRHSRDRSSRGRCSSCSPGRGNSWGHGNSAGIARSSGPPAASIILVANQTDPVDAGDFGGANRRRVEGRGGSGGCEQRGPECAQCDGFTAFSFRFGQTLDLMSGVRDSTRSFEYPASPAALGPAAGKSLIRAYACSPGLETNRVALSFGSRSATTGPANQGATREPSRTRALRIGTQRRRPR